MLINYLAFMPMDNLKQSGISYDTAIPIEWSNMVHQRIMHHYPDGINIAAHFVWAYPKGGGMFGGAMPVTFEGTMILQYLSEIPND